MCEQIMENQVVLPLPDWCDQEKENRSVCIYPCIVDIIKSIWYHTIETLSCCCGHGKRNPSVVIGHNVDQNGIDEVREIVETLDPDREWDILQWRLVRADR